MITEKINQSIMFSGNIFLEERTVVNLNATVTTEIGGYPNISVSVVDSQAYTENKQEIDAKIMAFMVKVLSKQAEVHTVGTSAVI